MKMRIKWYRKAASLILAAAMMVPCGMQAMAAEKDLEAASKKNPDVYAWITIPGTNIDYPVCQSTNDVFYLTHNVDKCLDANGALYTESAYNTRTFADPVTVIYGHNMRSGKMFGHLQETFQTGFGGHDEAIVYMDGKTHIYKLFIALPVGANHLLYGRNFNDKIRYKRFLDELMSVRSMEVVKNGGITPNVNDNLLILSTCMGGGRTNERYIVVGKRIR